MALFTRRKNRPGTVRSATPADEEHLTAFITSRRGVEAFLEPRTAITETTVVLRDWTARHNTDNDSRS